MALAFSLVAGLFLQGAVPSAEVPPAAAPGVMVTYEQRSQRSGGRALIGVFADGRGNARSIVAAGHGGIMFVTRDNVGYLVVDDGARPRVGLEEQMVALLVGARRGDLSRARVERMTRQRLDIAEGGTVQVLGHEGRIYQLTLVEGEARTRPFEIIISADPRLAPAGREILRHLDLLRAPLVAIAGSEPQPYTAARALFATGTPLRIGPLRLKEVEMRPLSGDMAALPGPVLGRAEFEAWLRATIMREDDAGQDDAPAQGAGDGRHPR